MTSAPHLQRLTPPEWITPFVVFYRFGVHQHDLSIQCGQILRTDKRRLSADRNEEAALLFTTPRSIPKSFTSDFASFSQRGDSAYDHQAKAVSGGKAI